MATRSTIALEYADGSVKQIYCHWDGYLDQNGKLLKTYWTDPSKVDRLISLGNLSKLGSELGEKHPFDCPYRYGTAEYNQWKSKYQNWCVFYCRDREEDLNVEEFASYADYLNSAPFEEYNYILRRDGRWYVEFHGEFQGLLDDAFEYNEIQEAE